MKTPLTALIALSLVSVAQAQAPATPKPDPFSKFGTSLDKGPQQVLPQVVNGVQLIKATYGAPGGPKRSVAPKVQKLLTAGNASAANRVQIFASSELLYGGRDQTQSRSGVRVVGPNAAIVETVTEAAPILVITYRVDGVEKTVTAARGTSVLIP